MQLKTLLLFLFFNAIASAAELPTDPAECDKLIWFLDKNTFNRTAVGTWLVFFATRWCPYCKKLTPKWLQLQSQLPESLLAKYTQIAKVDCTDNESWCTSPEVGVKGYPNVFLYHHGKFVQEYKNGHEVNLILAFLQEKADFYLEDNKKMGYGNLTAAPNNISSANVAISPQNLTNFTNVTVSLQNFTNSSIQTTANISSISNTTLYNSSNIISTSTSIPSPTISLITTSTTPIVPAQEPVLPKLKGFRARIHKKILAPLIGDKCATHVLLFHWFSEFQCSRLLVSKILGIFLVLGGAIIKVPQIVKIWNKRNAGGVSYASYLMETTAYLAGLVYNVRNMNPFVTYGEHVFMFLANCVVISLMFQYAGNSSHIFWIGMVALALLLYFMPYFILVVLQWVAIFIGVSSKLPQIMENFEMKSTGQLSAVTVFLQTIGSIARCFTTAVEVGDVVIFITYLVASVLNGLVLYQVVEYWGRPRRGKSLLD